MSKFIQVYETSYNERTDLTTIEENPSYVNTNHLIMFTFIEELQGKPHLKMGFDGMNLTVVVSQEDFTKLLKGGKND